MLEGVAALVQHSLGQAGLAHAAGTGDRDEPMVGQQRTQRCKVVVAADQRLQCRRQVRAQPQLHRSGLRVASEARIDRRRGEPIAPAGDRRDASGTQQLAQIADLHREVALFDNESRPDKIEQLVLCHDPVAMFDQRHQKVEGTRSQSRELTVYQQLSFSRLDREMLEAKHVLSRERAKFASWHCSRVGGFHVAI